MGSTILSAASQSLVRLPVAQSSHSSKLASTSFSSIACPRFPVSGALTLRLPVARCGWAAVAAQAGGGGETVETLEVDNGEEKELSEEKPKRPPIVKLGDIMGILHKQAIGASVAERPLPDLRVGDIIELKARTTKNKRRFTIYKGIVMSKQNAGIHTTIRVRRIIAGLGIEIVFPIYSPNIQEITVVSHRKVRRAKLYYLRDKLPRFSTFK